MLVTIFKVDGNNNECWIIEINPISVCMADGISWNPDNRLKFAFAFRFTWSGTPWVCHHAVLLNSQFSRLNGLNRFYAIRVEYWFSVGIETYATRSCLCHCLLLTTTMNFTRILFVIYFEGDSGRETVEFYANDLPRLVKFWDTFTKFIRHYFSLYNYFTKKNSNKDFYIWLSLWSRIIEWFKQWFDFIMKFSSFNSRLNLFLSHSMEELKYWISYMEFEQIQKSLLKLQHSVPRENCL